MNYQNLMELINIGVIGVKWGLYLTSRDWLCHGHYDEQQKPKEIFDSG